MTANTFSRWTLDNLDSRDLPSATIQPVAMPVATVSIQAWDQPRPQHEDSVRGTPSGSAPQLDAENSIALQEWQSTYGYSLMEIVQAQDDRPLDRAPIVVD